MSLKKQNDKKPLQNFNNGNDSELEGSAKETPPQRLFETDPVEEKEAPKSLEEKLKEMLEVFGPVHYNGVVKAIRDASVTERQSIISNKKILKLIQTRIGTPYNSLVVSELMVGSQEWKNPPANDFFDHFVNQGKDGVMSTSETMNCWESIIYAAHLVGLVNGDWIRKFYADALAESDPNAAIWKQLAFSKSLPTYDPAKKKEPSPGQLVFYLNGTSSIPGHVAVYVGNGEVISLWNQPDGIDSVQRIPIDKLSGTIYYGNAPW